MIIDAMDILHGGKVEGFCLVSRDSDYTRLSIRIKAEGLFVMGIGEKKTPKSLVNACHVFVYTENLTKKEIKTKKTSKTKTMISGKDHKSSKAFSEVEPILLLKKAFDMAVTEDGWAHLAMIGTHLHKLDPGFDPRTFGHKQLVQLIESYNNLFEIKRTKKKGPTAVYAKLKE